MQKEVVINSLSDNEFLGEMLIEDVAENDLVIHPLIDTILLKIFKEKLYELLSNDHEIALDFLHHSSSAERLIQEKELNKSA